MAVEELLGSLPYGWEYTTLGAACERGGGDIQTGPFGSQLHASDYVLDGIPSIMPQNIGDNRIIENDIARITHHDAKRLSRYLVRKGDIVCSRRGDVERRALIREHEHGWLCGTGCLRVRLGDNGVNAQYASFYFGHPNVREWIVRHAHGATMPNLNTSILAACPFVVPPRSEQLASAHILGILDDKIELNRRMNETLQAMAQALFKSWFMDFDPVRVKMERRHPAMAEGVAGLFPDSWQDSSQDSIPKGWRVGTLGEAVTIHDSKRVPLSARERAERKGPYPYYGAASVMDYVNDYLFDGVYVLLGEDGSVVNDDDSPVLQYVWGKFWVNNHAHVLTGRDGVSGEHLFLFLRTVNIRPFITGAVQPKLNQGNLCRIPFLLAPKQVNESFASLIDPIYARIRMGAKESRTLTSLRDTLLPKLLSGEIRVRQAEKMVEEAV